ncbi:MAG TPA: FAD-dependent oxidoreductase, partial [Acidilobales archaeon]|nr:FAD-dependent oxidoreductase [Acidilobales archaeon]
MKFYKLCIIGGGLAGLSLAYYLVSLGVKDVVIIEKSEVPGGLLTTKHIRGYTFDVGGSHIIFSKDKEILNEMLYIL